MSAIERYFNRNVPRLTGPEHDLDERSEQLRNDLAEHLRKNSVALSRHSEYPPPSEYAPQPDYSIERAESFLSRHLEEISLARASLAVEVQAAEVHLAELKRRVGVTTIVHDALAETLTKLTGRVAELDEQTEGFPS